MRMPGRTAAKIAATMLMPIAAQAQAGTQAGTVMAIESSGAAVERGVPVREIDDPQNGARWVLYAPVGGGPGELVLVQRGFTERREAQAGRSGGLPQWSAVIRGGDRVILEEHTPVVDARLEAIALAPAREGGTLRVRLKIGGGIVEAVALGPGRVAFAPETEARP